ncbi:MAG: 2OG-Fe(II) oxygenase [Ktedonobacteraceae bacterium]
MTNHDQDHQLLVEDSLSFHSLFQLLNGEVLAIRIPNFYEKEKCKHLSEILSDIVKSESTSSGKIYLSDVDSFWNTLNKPEVRAKYFARSVPTMRKLRKLSFPFISPIDLLRLELDEIWPGGASLMRLQNEAMLFGLTRIWSKDSEASPHQDILLREIPHASEVQGQLSQLGVNIYLKTAERGGELEIWNHVFSDEDCLKLGVEGSYGFDRSFMPEDSLCISPQEGDLIFLNTVRVHSVRKIEEGERITISGFIGYWGKNVPLKCWS